MTLWGPAAEAGKEPSLRGFFTVQADESESAAEDADVVEPDRSGLARELFNTVKNYLLARQAKAMGLEPKDEGALWETPPEKSLIVSLTIGKVLEEEPEPELTREEIVDFYRSHPMYHGLKFEAAREKVVTRLTSEKRRANAIDRLRDRFGVKILVD